MERFERFYLQMVIRKGLNQNKNICEYKMSMSFFDLFDSGLSQYDYFKDLLKSLWANYNKISYRATLG